MLLRASLAGFYVWAACADYAPPRYTIDLNMDPRHRWDHVVEAERDRVVKSVRDVLYSPTLSKFTPVAKALIGNEAETRRLFPGDLYAELEGIASASGLETSELALVGAFYDLFAAADNPLRYPACSGIVAQSMNGEIFHGRNLDFGFKEDLAPMTMVVDFARNGRTVFTAVTFGPNPTFNTVVRWGSWSASQNERDTGSVLENFWDLLVQGRPALFARMRQAAEQAATFDEAVGFFHDVRLDSSAYFVLGGTRPGEGAVVTRGRDGATDMRRLAPWAGQWFLVETNYDPSVEPPKGDDRRHPLERAMAAIGQAGLGKETLWGALSYTAVDKADGERAPLNKETIYSTVMQASNPLTFQTEVRAREREVGSSAVVV